MPREQAYGGDILYDDIAKFFAKGLHGESDLKLAVARICDSWKTAQLESRGLTAGSDMAVLLQKLSRSLQSVVHRQSGTLDEEKFKLLRPQIEEAWQRQLRGTSNPPSARAPSPGPSVAEARFSEEALEISLGHGSRCRSHVH